MVTRIILRSRVDGRFASGAFTWTPYSELAEEFPNALAANQFADSHVLKGMEIIVIREKLPDLRIPLDRI